MIVGIPKEIKADENRVAMTPAGVEIMKQNRHTVLIEKQAGKPSGFEDADYEHAGAEIVASSKDIFNRS
ncbi:MAG: alanine dehydrogenase, partial [Desulfobacterales bacterium]